MMQAIQTKRNGYTGFRATCAAKTIIVGLDDALSHDDQHRKAAEKLVADLGWNGDGYGTLVSGCLKDGTWVHVLTGRDGQGDWK